MPQSLSRILVHLVFSTKNREPFIAPPHRDRTFAYLGGTLNALGCASVIVGGMPDHVHLLFVQSKAFGISKIVEELKKESSKWAKQHVHPAFYWQNGYGSFSVSPWDVEVVQAYIAGHEEHHRGQAFQDELRELFRRNRVEWDERYVWD